MQPIILDALGKLHHHGHRMFDRCRACAGGRPRSMASSVGDRGPAGFTLRECRWYA